MTFLKLELEILIIYTRSKHSVLLLEEPGHSASLYSLPHQRQLDTSDFTFLPELSSMCLLISMKHITLLLHCTPEPFTHIGSSLSKDAENSLLSLLLSHYNLPMKAQRSSQPCCLFTGVEFRVHTLCSHHSHKSSTIVTLNKSLHFVLHIDNVAFLLCKLS